VDERHFAARLEIPAGESPWSWHLFDVGSRTVRPLPHLDEAGARRPSAVVRAGRPGVATAGPRVEVIRMEYNWLVRMVDLADGELWTHQMHARPITLTVAADSSIVLASTPTKKYWSDYSNHLDLTDRTLFVACGRTGRSDGRGPPQARSPCFPPSTATPVPSTWAARTR